MAPQAGSPKGWEPQLATLVKAPPAGDEWLHEFKFDGYRIGCDLRGKDVRLVSRRGKDWTEQFPEVVAAARKLPVKQAFIDGEVAILLPDGRTSFQALQNIFSGASRQGLVYFAFDLLSLDGHDLRRLPLEERKAALAKLLKKSKVPLFRFSDHVMGNGPAFLARACQMGLEGVVSKRRDRPYSAGRTTDWVKSKCTKRQEFVIGGFTDPEGSREGIGALILGVRDDRGNLQFAGKVGTGFTQKSARDLRKRLDALEQKTSPFASQPPTGWLGKNPHWVKPRLVAEVAFAEWTDEGRARHPSFQGLRLDKNSNEVVIERPAPLTTTRENPPSKSHATPRPTSPPLSVPLSPRAGRGRGEGPPKKNNVATVTISHPDRVIFPAINFTKIELARFYEEIAHHALPHFSGRPLTLVRCPKGIPASGPSGCFFMKHVNNRSLDALQTIPIRDKSKTSHYPVVKDTAGIIELVQMNALEIHTSNGPANNFEKPNRVVFDLDPGPEVKFAAVIEAAWLVRRALQTLGLESFVKNTGGRGLHVVVPLVPERSWDECAAFSRGLAVGITRHDPSLYSATLTKAGRENKIFIDYLRNNRSATSIAAFSTRTKPTGPVSVPLAWDELDPKIRSDHFTVRTLGQRLATLKKDPWARYDRLAQRLTAAALGAVTAILAPK